MGFSVRILSPCETDGFCVRPVGFLWDCCWNICGIFCGIPVGFYVGFFCGTHEGFAVGFLQDFLWDSRRSPCWISTRISVGFCPVGHV